jgi:FtsP/CotA-like multicopper oxidase with cupredoxin domain
VGASRSQALHRSLLGLAGALALLGVVRPSAASTSAPGAQAAAGELIEPPVIASRHGVLHATLVASEQRVQVGDEQVLAKVYNGSYAGPTLRVRPGDLVKVRLINRLHEATDLHFHGLTVTPKGHGDDIYVSVPAGGTFQYSFRLPRNAAVGSYWYHSHEMEPSPASASPTGTSAAALFACTGIAGVPATGRFASLATPATMRMLAEEQVFDGLSGVIEVADLRRYLPAGLRHVRERVLSFKDAQVKDGAILSAGIDSDAPTTRLLDGQREPQLTIGPDETQLWHLANVGANIFYDLHLDGHHFEILAQDGRPVVRPVRAADLVLPPGKRFDVLVRGASAGTASLRTIAYSQGHDLYPGQLLATLRTTGPRERAQRFPVFVERNQPDLRKARLAHRRQIVLSEARAFDLFFINGRPYDPSRVDVHARLNTVEEWVLVNSTTERHPFHLHTYPMQVISENGHPARFDGYQDEVILPPLGRVAVRIRFAEFTGETVFHCHILAHEDHGMMADLLVTK